jgi:SAM-dependent methyltransferase
MIPETLTTATPTGELQKAIRFIQGEEREWMLVGDRRNKITLPWMPFQPAEFTAIMFDVMAETNGVNFLDVGCGIGTKMLLAEKLYRLNVYGIELDRAMVQVARSHWPTRANVVHGDALYDYEHMYEQADIIWLYRPFRDAATETYLETTITESMKPGAILAGGKWQMDQPPSGWQPIVDDWDGGNKCGAWQKPG